MRIDFSTLEIHNNEEWTQNQNGLYELELIHFYVTMLCMRPVI